MRYDTGVVQKIDMWCEIDVASNGIRQERGGKTGILINLNRVLLEVSDEQLLQTVHVSNEAHEGGGADNTPQMNIKGSQPASNGLYQG